MQQNRIINDTVYGHIPYSGIEEKFLHSKIVNRLLFVSQNALTYFVFPSITTKCYIHSIGTMHIDGIGKKRECHLSNFASSPSFGKVVT